ncbi:MAG TPA: hypothetical protein VNS09_15965 [Solirubrobacter sp.]|nr:hypothetical protein [Solirubrobacter sp.]
MRHELFIVAPRRAGIAQIRLWRSRSGALWAAVCAIVLVALAVQPDTSWAAVKRVRVDLAGGGPVSCPSTDQCTLVDEWGRAVTFNPLTFKRTNVFTIDSDASEPPSEDWSFLGLACPSTTQCTAVDSGGRAVTFNPLVVSQPPAVRIGPTNTRVRGFYGLACPTTTQCTAVDHLGMQVTFDPATPEAVHVVSIASADYVASGFACPSVSHCVTMTDGASQNVTVFDPTASVRPTPFNMTRQGDWGYQSAVACPAVTQCTVVNDSVSLMITFDPTALRRSRPRSISHNLNGSLHIRCPDISRCVVMDLYGRVVTVNPKTFKHSKTRVLISSRDRSYLFVQLACPSPERCFAVDVNGWAYPFVPHI